jgi:hypothetical protein
MNNTDETPREYKDWDGNPIALSKLVRHEPDWAVAQIMHRDQLERELAAVTAQREFAEDQLKGTCSLNRLLREEKDKLARERDGFKARVQEFDDAMCDEISHHMDAREERDTAKAELKEAVGLLARAGNALEHRPHFGSPYREIAAFIAKHTPDAGAKEGA